MPSYIRTRTEFAVNSFTAANQTAPSVSTFADGGFVVVWGSLDPAQDGSESAIKAQLFDSAGSKVGAEFLVNSFASGHQFTASVTTLSDGRFIVSWVTSGSQNWVDGIKAQLFSRSGEPIGGEFGVNATPSPVGVFAPYVAELANGGFVIGWDDWGETRAQIYGAAGEPVGGEFRLNANGNAVQDSVAIVGLSGGGFVATWRTADGAADGAGDAVKAQLFNAAGGRVGGEFLVNSHKADSQYDPAVTALAGGGFVVTWATRDSAQDGNGGAVKAQIFSASGAKVGGEFLVNSQASDTQRDAVVTATPDGGFVVAWTNWHGAQDGSGAAIKAQAFDASGVKVGGEMLVNTLVGGSQFLPDIATLADGRVIVTWTSETGDSGGYAVRAQILGFEVAPPLPNARPVIISNGGGTSASLTLDERAIEVTTVVASDDGEPNNLRYSITGGWDAALFRINALTGALSFAAPLEYEERGSNFYTVVVTASDGELSSWQSLQISLRNLNEIHIISDGGGDHAMIHIDENRADVTTVSAVDRDGAALTYSIEAGEDAGFFTIDAQTGVLSFVAAPDYEWPADMDHDNVYIVYVTASDGTVSDTQGIGVVIGDLDENGPSSVAVEIEETSTEVTVVEAPGAVYFEIVGGDDAWLFHVHEDYGWLDFRNAPDFEAFGDSDGDNVYEVVVRAYASRDSFEDKSLSVTVRNVDEAPEFHSYWGAENVSLTVGENDWRVGTVAASDPEADTMWPVTYHIAGGADATHFTVDRYSGALDFSFRPDFEAPVDADRDNVYDVVVAAVSGMLSEMQSFAVEIRNENEGIFITSDGGGTSATISTSENQAYATTVSASDPDGTSPRYWIVGGPDASLFAIDDSTGVLSFIAAPDYEAPADEGTDNSYAVEVAATDGEYTTRQTLRILVGNVNEGLAITSGPAVSVTENSTSVSTVAASDVDGDDVSYAIAGGADAALFAIDAASGELRFIDAPDFEAGGDATGDNVYDVVVWATDGGFTDRQTLAVTVVNANEPLAITSGATFSIAENGRSVGTVAAHDQDGDRVSFAIVGGADAGRFAIDAASGALSFVTAPDHDAPADAGGDNVYDIVVSATDGAFTDAKALSVTVTNVREGNTIVGTSGNNTISTTTSVSGQPRATNLEDTIYGLGGTDTIAAGGGADLVDGGAGNDTITGGLGADVLTGGTGADRFVYNAIGESAVAAPDVITDFQRGQSDRINLNAIDANSRLTSNQNFTFIGAAAFSGSAGQLRFEQIGGNTFVSGDVDGDRAADFLIQLNGLVPLTSSDFVL